MRQGTWHPHQRQAQAAILMYSIHFPVKQILPTLLPVRLDVEDIQAATFDDIVLP
jgi:hypothetical protein